MNIFKRIWRDFSKRVIHDNRGIWPALAFLANPAFWQGTASAASAGGSIASIFGRKKKGGTMNLEEMLPSWQRESLQGLSAWALPLLKQYTPGQLYGGRYTAEMTPFERLGLTQLGDLLGGPPTGELFGAGKEQLLGTLGGTYADVEKSPWIKSMINLSKMNLTDLISEARAKRGARGTYFTEEGLREESRLGERTQNYLNTIIGQFIEGERERQFRAVPLAGAFEEYEKLTAPLKRITASQTLGSLGRLLEQSELESRYQDYLRARGEMTLPVSATQGLAGGTPFPSTLQAPSEPSSLSNILGLLGKLNLGNLFGGQSSFANVGGMGRVPVAPPNYYLTGGY